MKVTEEYGMLDALAAVLFKRALTVAAIARVFNRSRPVAHDLVKQLRKAVREQGFRLVETKVREGKSGPLSIAYQVVKAGRR